MKARLFLLLTYVILFACTSCTHHSSKDINTEVTSLDSTWSVMKIAAATFTDSLNDAIAHYKKTGKTSDTMICCKIIDAKDSLMRSCRNNLSTFKKMKMDWLAQKPYWDSLAHRISKLKDNFYSGKVSNEANETIAQLQTAVENRNKIMREFAAKFHEVQKSCMEKMERCRMKNDRERKTE